jgi:predicted nucleic acid-binding Zn ribbon protein
VEETKIIEALGGKCIVCGYNTCHSSMSMHHIDPSKKNFSFGSVRKIAKSFDKILNELKKCCILCHNCHGEYHDGLIKLPNDIEIVSEKLVVEYEQKIFDLCYDKCPVCGKFKKKYNMTCSYECRDKLKQIKYENLKQKNEIYERCPICGGIKRKGSKTCSTQCGQKSEYKVNWNEINLSEEIKNKSCVQIGKELGVSDRAVRKRLLKLGITNMRDLYLKRIKI